MRFNIPNLSAIRQKYPEMLDAITALHQAIANGADQSNADVTATSSSAPAAITALNVVSKGGIHDIQVQDQSPANRGLNYFAEYSQTPDFANAHKIDMGASQNHRANLGDGQYYWRAYSAYGTSDHSTPIMHGGATAAVVGSGTYNGPEMQPSQGAMGFGPKYRNSPTPPVRS